MELRDRMKPEAAYDPSDPRMEQLLAHAGWIRSLARSLVKDASVADDLVQETWLAALRQPPLADRPLRPWLAQVLRNFARMRLRGESNRAEREESSARDARALPSPAELVERVETQRLLTAAVLGLDEPFRSTVLLRYYEGLSAAEIARRVGRPSATVRWRLMRGLEELRRQLDERHGDRKQWCSLLLPLAREGGGGLAVLTPLSMLAALGGLAALAWIGIALWQLAEPGSTRPTDLASELAGRAAAGGGDRASEGSGIPPAAPRDARSPVSDAKPSGAASPLDASASAAFDTLVRARVLDGEGRPLSGARLRWLGNGRADEGADAISGADGRVALRTAGVAQRARYELQLSREHCATRTVGAVLDPGVPAELGDLALESGGSLEGRVTDALGAPFAGATVRRELAAGRWRDFSSQPLEEARILGSMLEESAPSFMTGADGRFRFDGLELGYYRLWASAEGVRAAYSQPTAVRAGAVAQCEPLLLALPSAEECIGGVVLDEEGAPVAGAELECARRSTRSVFFEGEPWVVRTRADAQGSFRLYVGPFRGYDLAARDPRGELGTAVLHGLSPGAQTVQVRLPSARTFELRVVALVAAGDPGGAAALGEARIELLESEKRAPLHFPASSGAVRKGAEGSGAWTVRVPHVAFRIRVRARGFQTAELGPLAPGAVPQGSEGLEIRLAPAPRVSGRVLAPEAASGTGKGTRKPCAGARVQLLPLLPDSDWQLVEDSRVARSPWASRVQGRAQLDESITDSEGRFALDLPAEGEFLLRAEHAGFAPSSLGPLRGSREMSLADQELELDAGGALEGRVLVHAGESAAGRLVGATNGDGFLRSARTLADGSYRIEQLAPGSWQVGALEQEASAATWSRLEGGNGGEGEQGPGAPPRISREPEWSAKVFAGRSTHFDLDLTQPTLAVLAGTLLLDGASPGPWAVALRSLEGAAPGRPLYGELDPEGKFQLGPCPAGRYELLLWSHGYKPAVSSTVRDVVELHTGENRWGFARESAQIRVELGTARGSLAHVTWEGAERSWTTRAPIPAGPPGPPGLPGPPGQSGASGASSLTLPVPAGPGRLARLDVLPAATPWADVDPRTVASGVELEVGPHTVAACRLP
jgi:RNA polymerase sigma factor (sigma-70 family)